MYSFNKDRESSFIELLKIADIKYIVYKPIDKKIIPNCIKLNIINEIYLKKAIRNFLVKSLEEKFLIGKIKKNECWQK